MVSWQSGRQQWRLQSPQGTHPLHMSLHTLGEIHRQTAAATDSYAEDGKHYPRAHSSVLAPTDREFFHLHRPSPETITGIISWWLVWRSGKGVPSHQRS